ncbi:MAG: LTA synthase family protein [Oscillospiraceae bacterium]|nr:LTA synthase family protein [Oscillospiraceae bacterium]
MQPEKVENNWTLLRRALKAALTFLPALLFWELLLSIQLEGKFALPAGMLLFLPAQCAALGFLPCLCPNERAGRVFCLIELAGLCLFYGANLIYFRIFGSLIPLSMIGMGMDAVTNFGWALRSTLKESVGWILFLLLPLVLYVPGLRHFRPNFSLRGVLPRAVLSLAAIVLWLLGAVSLPLGGTEPQSVYAAYHDAGISSNDSAARLGVLTSTLLGLRGETAQEMDLLSDGNEEVPVYPLVKEELPAEEAAPQLPETMAVAPAEAAEAKVIDRSGPNILPEIDFAALAEGTQNKALKELSEYFGAKTPTSRNAYTGMFADCDLIYICAEAFTSWAIDPQITPTLYRLSTQGILLPNYYNSFRNTTTNGEFAFLTGLWPDTSRNANEGSSMGSMSQSAENTMPFGLGTMFRQQLGASAYGYHNYLGSYYNRKNSLENLGFTTKFMDDGMTFSSSWPASDLEMMQQSVDDYISGGQYVAYYMTFSGHGPYTPDNVIYEKNIKTLESLLNGRSMNAKVKGYLACNLELEYAMEYLLQRLEEAGRLERTVIVIAGDHYPYYLDVPAVSALLGHTVEAQFESGHSGCILWSGALEEPIVNEVPCCNVDLLPTVLNLFGLEYDSRLLAGTDVFSDGLHAAVLYNRNFVSEVMMYEYASGKFQWTGPKEDFEKTAARAYYKSMCSWLNRNIAASLSVVANDYYDYVWTASGLKAAETDAE